MQHHGAPTRLLDWTVSPYVAAFFAVAEDDGDQPAAIWAVNGSALKAGAVSALRQARPEIDGLSEASVLGARDVFARVFLARTDQIVAAVAPVEPFRTSERLTVQQGLFLCPTTLRATFEVSLKRTLKQVPQYRGLPRHEDLIHKLAVGRQARVDLLRRLHQMNITYATLFPGLDGFSKSLRTYLEIINAECLDALMGEELGRMF
jgi:hypothetical protein